MFTSLVSRYIQYIISEETYFSIHRMTLCYFVPILVVASGDLIRGFIVVLSASQLSLFKAATVCSSRYLATAAIKAVIK